MTILSAVPLYPVVTPQTLPQTGIAPTYTAAPTGLTFRDGGGAILHVKNGGGSPTTVTIPRSSLTDLALSVPAGGERFFGPFPSLEDGPISAASAADPANAGIPGLYSDYSNASFSVTTGVTYALFGIPFVRGLRRNIPTEGSGVPIVAGTTALTVQPLDAWAANTPTYSAAAAAGNHLSATGGADGLSVSTRWVAHVKNAGGSPTSVTIQARGFKPPPDLTWTGLINSPVTPIVVPAGGEILWTFPGADRWTQDIQHTIYSYVVLSYSVTTSVTVAVFDARVGWGDQ